MLGWDLVVRGSGGSLTSATSASTTRARPTSSPTLGPLGTIIPAVYVVVSVAGRNCPLAAKIRRTPTTTPHAVQVRGSEVPELPNAESRAVRRHIAVVAGGAGLSVMER